MVNLAVAFDDDHASDPAELDLNRSFQIAAVTKPWNEKVVVVTGASAGLGLAIARAFIDQGATLVPIARDGGKLAELFKAVPTAFPEVADVMDDESIQRAVANMVEKLGRIDVWVNNVGQSTRTTFEDCSLESYARLMDVNFYSAVRCTLAALPHLKTSEGLVVNIGSLASKTAWRFVSPYVTSKHALAAFSHQIRLEGPAGVNCLLVCPGPIQRNDAGQRYAEATAGMDNAASAPGAGVRLKGISPTRLAQKIEFAARRRKRVLVVPGYARILFAIEEIWPALGDWILRRFSKSSGRDS